MVRRVPAKSFYWIEYSNNFYSVTALCKVGIEIMYKHTMIDHLIMIDQAQVEVKMVFLRSIRYLNANSQKMKQRNDMI